MYANIVFCVLVFVFGEYAPVSVAVRVPEHEYVRNDPFWMERPGSHEYMPNYMNRNIERPCHAPNLNCVREYFARHSMCKRAMGYVPSPVYREEAIANFPNVNFTFLGTDITYTGVDGVLKDFYINRETDKLVLFVQYRNVTIFSQKTYYIFHRRGQEPVVTADYLYTNFKSLSTTTIIPDLRDLQLRKSDTYTYVDDANPAHSFGPRASMSSDPVVPRVLQAFDENLATEVQEYFLTEGIFLAVTYIQNKICDFGVRM